MSDANSLSNRYGELIDSIVDITLQGKIRSKEQVYQMLVGGITQGTGEIFERTLDERVATTKAQLETKVKATRIMRALQTIQGEWERWQKENQTDKAIAIAIERIREAESPHYLLPFLKVIDGNNPQGLTREQLQKLSQTLKSESQSVEEIELANGIMDGLNAFSILETDLISWIYEQNQSALGFGSERQGPWSWWEKKTNSPLSKQLFQTLAKNESVIEFSQRTYQVELRAWVELIILLQYLQQGLVTWFDQQPYNAQFGQKLSYSTFLTFAVILGQLSQGLEDRNFNLREGFFLMMLQVLRKFAKRSDFPLYGGIFASFSGDYLRETFDYFTDPLKQVERTQEKARIITLLGYSQRTLGHYQQAKTFHEEALEIAREASDYPCEIANFNHLSRLSVQEKNYSEAINYSQRALILARQVGDKLGEANALVNVGYGEVLKAREIEAMEPMVYESAINYLNQGLTLAERLGEFQSQALAYNSLGIAYVVLSQPVAAITALEKGTQVAINSGDLYLQGLNFAYLAEGYYSLGNPDQAVCYGGMGMYLLSRIDSAQWRQPAGLLSIIKGKMNNDEFYLLLEKNRSQITKLIGVDGYNILPELLKKYQEE